jgi:hypothetical protein
LTVGKAHGPKFIFVEAYVMDYALTLYFDKVTENYFNKIINAIATSGASSYITDIKMPPHITVASFHTDEIKNIIDLFDKNYLSFTADNIIWTSLGVFVPQVLYAAPVLSKYLQDFCDKINQLIKPYVEGEPDKFYLPYNWVPHTSLALKLNSHELKVAFDIALQQFIPIAGKIDRLTLAECNPYKEIKIWDLV